MSKNPLSNVTGIKETMTASEASTYATVHREPSHTRQEPSYRAEKTLDTQVKSLESSFEKYSHQFLWKKP